MTPFQQFLFLVATCVFIFYLVFEYNVREEEKRRKKREEDEKIMSLLAQESEPKRNPPRRFPIY